MNLLADACVSIQVVEALRAHPHDVSWAGEWGPKASDDEVLARARSEGRTLLTLDKDFGQLAILQGASHSGIVRVVDIRVLEQPARIEDLLRTHEADLRDGAIITLERSRIRIRPR